jgi:hypothetical protein
MGTQSPAPPPASPDSQAPERPSAASTPAATQAESKPRAASTRATGRASTASRPVASGAADRRPAADYASTRLVNFRIPVDLHDRYRQLVREAEQRHPRLRHPSLTELVIALLEEGPSTADEVAEVIRRKRVDELTAGELG